MHGGQRVTEVRRGDARAHARAAEAERVRVESGGADDRRQHSLARTRTPGVARMTTADGLG